MVKNIKMIKNNSSSILTNKKISQYLLGTVGLGPNPSSRSITDDAGTLCAWVTVDNERLSKALSEVLLLLLLLSGPSDNISVVDDPF